MQFPLKERVRFDASLTTASVLLLAPPVQYSPRTKTALKPTLRRRRIRVMALELSDLDLEIAARACRALAYRQTEDAKKIENPTVRGPIERTARHAAVLAERFEVARNAGASKAR